MADAKRTEGEPHDRLTRLTVAMTDALEAHPEYGVDVKTIVFLQDGDRGGLQIFGYDSDADAIADVLLHLKAIFESNGQTLVIAPLGQG